MRSAVSALSTLTLLLGGCFDDVPATIAVDTPAVTVPMGASTELGVWVDGRELEKGDAFSWVVERPDLVVIAVTEDGAHVRITGRAEGHTTIHLGYQIAAIDLPATIAPPAVLALALDPLEVSAPVGTMVPVHATATYTTGDVLDVSAATTWAIDDPAIAAIDPIGGGVRGMAAGTTTLHASIDGTERSATVTIAP